MTEKKEHPQAEWLRAIADGETLQWFNGSGWPTVLPHDILSLIARGSESITDRLRIKPRTITIGRYEVAEPILVAPEIGTRYFYLCPGSEDCLDSYKWEGVFELERRQLKSGMCWLNREDAELAAKAISELLTGTK